MPRINGNMHLWQNPKKPPIAPAGQSRKHSLVESLTNIAIGFFINLAVQIAVYPWFGANFTLQQNLQLGGIFTIVAIIRSYCLRRLFNRITIKWRR